MIVLAPELHAMMYLMKIFFVVALNKESDVIRFFLPSRYTTPSTAKFAVLVLRLQSRNSPKLLSSVLTHIVVFRNSMMERNAFKCFYMLPLRLYWSFLIMYLFRGQICEQIHTCAYLFYEDYKIQSTSQQQK